MKMDKKADPYKETFNTWNKIAELYQEKFMDLDLYNATYDAFCNLVAPKGSVLEIGCGPGNITRYVLKERPDLKLTGIDIAPNMITLAQKNNPLGTFKVMDSRTIDTLNDRFDAILCGFCLPYLSETDCSKLIADSFTLLNNDGILYLSFVEGDPASSAFISGSSGDRTFFYYHDTAKLRSDLHVNAFQRLSETQINYIKNDGGTEVHTVLLARKITH